MKELPRGIFTRPDRPGYWWRDRRGGYDRWHSAATVAQVVALRRSMREGAPMPNVTVQKAARAWLERYIRTSRNEQGQRLARQRVESHLVPVLGPRPLSMLRPDHLRQYRIALEEKGLSPQSVAHMLADARGLLLWCVEAGWLGRTPFPRRLMPRIQEQHPDRLMDAEVDILTSLIEPRGFVMRFLIGTGLRWGEARRADASHVERDQLVVAQTKTGRVRRIPLTPALLSEIRCRIGRLVPVEKAQTVASWGRRAGVERFHAHMTRHTFACRWLERGGSLTALSELLGHTSIKMTQRYGKPSESSVRQEARSALG